MKADPCCIFVYGTLLPGEPRWPILEPLAAKGAHRPAVVPGALYDTGLGYPCADFTAEGHIPGLIVSFAEGMAERALQILDRVEGTDYSLYERVLVTSVEGDTAWSYSWMGDHSAFSRIDRWISRQ
jgi:gamma-glutamylcyclotransferase (GGCT)/AIG2-like uncharacterized protein YtfP